MDTMVFSIHFSVSGVRSFDILDLEEKLMVVYMLPFIAIDHSLFSDDGISRSCVELVAAPHTRSNKLLPGGDFARME